MYIDWIEPNDDDDLPIEKVFGERPVTKMDASTGTIHSGLRKVRNPSPGVPFIKYKVNVRFNSVNS